MYKTAPNIAKLKCEHVNLLLWLLSNRKPTNKNNCTTAQLIKFECGEDSLTHRGIRSEGAKKRRVFRQLRREALKYVVKHAFHDVIWAETICRVDKAEIVNYLSIHYPEEMEGLQFEDEHIHELAEKGLVLADSRGRGAMQK